MKNSSRLNISGALLENKQFYEYIEKIAISHNLKKFSNRKTFPIKVLKEDFNYILETYQLLSKHIKIGIKIHSAGEWILDNFYIIEKNVKIIEKELNYKQYKNLPALASGKYEGFARIFVLAGEIVGFTEYNISEDNVKSALTAYQNKKELSFDEIEKLPIFLKIILIGKIRDICEKIYSSQMQKYRAQSIINRLIEKKEIKEEHRFNQRDIDRSKFTFIEYMSFQLKKYGKLGIDYQTILENEVSKLGLSVSSIIQKEHLYIANLKIEIGNCIKSIKNIDRINIGEILENISLSEKLLNKDPAEVYPKMDEETKSRYRNEIQNISKKAKVSEIYIAENVLKLAQRYKFEKRELLKRKSHVGYYIIDKGKTELEEIIYEKRKRILSREQKARLYVSSIIAFSLFIDFIITLFIHLKTNNFFYWILSFFILLVPVLEIILRLENYILLKIKRPRIIPKMNYESSIPKNLATFVVIPCILNSKEKVTELAKKLEVYYLANSQENLYFAILGDCTEAKKAKEDFDEDIIKTGIDEIRKLNEKYKNDMADKFYFLYRKREWNDSESAFIGWERKRGLLVTFNLYIKNKIKNTFLVNTLEFEKNKIPNIKYIITLDSDTNLVLNTANKLIGAMDHILNRPVIQDRKVIQGYAIMQPRIGLDMNNSKKTKFVEIYSGPGGIDFYSNAISDVYQDYLEEGIFTGKGIYDVDAYNEILDNEIPENTVLSHDLLEGNFLRCALVSDVTLLDGFPKKYLSYMQRNHRWVRGDFQIIRWLKSPRLNIISKFKIFDNIRRSSLIIVSLLVFLAGIMFLQKSKIFALLLIFFSIFSLEISYFIDIIDYIIFKKSRQEDSVNASKKFSKDYNRASLSIIRGFLTIILLPYEAYKNLDAIVRSIIRMRNKKNLLQWTTAEDSEKNCRTNLIAYYKEMISNVIFGIFIIICSTNLLIRILGALWILAPSIMLFLSMEQKEKLKYNSQDKKLLIEIGKRTWEFFEDFIKEENNYLMIDNYQEDRIEKTVKRTSSTNIGLEIITIISAYDLGYIKTEKAVEYLKKIISTVKILPKWNGHLYNWYKTDTLEPLKPRYISTVDSGNFVGYLYVVKSFLEEKQIKDTLYEDINNLIINTDFSALYNDKFKLLSIGFNIEDNLLTDSYYDFLASEARQASFIGIAKKDIPEKHWNYLSRTLTTIGKYKGLVSWTGTTFEYLMPNIIIKRYEGSLIDESIKFAIYCQTEYARKFFVPWGISESAFNLKDLNYHYQYKAFGVPWLGLKRGLEEDLVISPYSTFLTLDDTKKKGISNIKKLIDEGAYGRYGFYESIDYTPKRLNVNQKKAVVKTYMAHHQGLIINSINNYLNMDILIKRFHKNPEIEAIDVLLQEKMPKDMILTKQKKNNVSKFKVLSDSNYFERTIDNINNMHAKINVLANDNYHLIIKDNGISISKYKNNLITEYKKTSDVWQGIHFYLKNLKTKKITDFYSNTKVQYFPDKSKFIKNENNLKLELNVTIDPNSPVEIRTLEITNTGNSEELLEIVGDFVPILSDANQEYSHPAFNKLFLQFEEKNSNIIVQRKDRNFRNDVFLASTLYTENEQIGDFEYEIDREKYLGRENISVPKMIKENENFSSEISSKTDYIVAMKRTLKIRPNQKIKIALILTIGEEKEKVVEKINQLKSNIEIEKIFEIAKARAEEELRYLQINANNSLQYYELLDYLLDNNFSMSKNCNFQKFFQINLLWKFGISGTKPILLIKINKLEDTYILEELINAFLFFRNKKIYTDLIILNRDNETNNLLRNSVDEIILNKQIQFLSNIPSGIHILDEEKLTCDEKDIIEFKAKIIIDKIDNLKNFLKAIEPQNESTELIGENAKDIDKKNEPLESIENSEDSYGKLSEDGKEFLIELKGNNNLPAPWSNILSNKFFGTLVTENMGGFTWNKNSRLNRLTAWNNDPVLNIPSEIIYIKDIYSNKIWTLNNNINSPETKYRIIYGFGYVRFLNEQNQMKQETTIFVPNNENLKVTSIKLSNNSENKKVLKILLYIKNVLGEDENFTEGNLNLMRKGNTIFVKNCISQDSFAGKIMFVSSDLKVKSYTGEKENFFGNGNILKPDALFKEALNNETGLGKSNCVAVEYELEIKAFEEKHFFILLGEKNKIEEVEKIVSDYNNEKITKEYAEMVNNWENVLGTIKIKIPDKELEKLLNGWIIYQSISSRLYARSSFYQSGGAFGFRDQLQDCLALKFIDSEILKNQIIICARHQFYEGDVLHWWHDETKRGVRTKFSDDLLWMVYGTIEYINFTGNYNILDEQIEFLKGKALEKNEDEKYDVFYQTEDKESLFNHCIKAIEKSLNFGKNGIPKIGSGDWNDGFSNIGKNGERRKRVAWFFLV